MKIENNKDTMMACRFCPMCRQVCTIGNISKFESDFPRGKAMNIFGVYNGNIEYDDDVVSTLYNCCLCGVCKAHCLGEIYDLPGLIKDSRKDIVDQNREPGVVQEIRESLIKNNNPFGKSNKDPFKSSGNKKGDLLYYMGPEVKFNNHEIAESVIRILKKAKETPVVLNDEPDCGKILSLLGYEDDARSKAEELYTMIRETGCRSIIVSSPLCYDAFKNDYPKWGLKLEPGIKIYHSSEYINKLVQDKKIKIKKTNGKVTLSDSEFLGLFNDIFEPPRELIRSVAGDNFIEMHNSGKNMLATGEAAFVFRGKRFGVDAQIGERISKMADEADVDTIITLSARAKNNIGKVSNLKVKEISEYISEII